MDFDKQKYKVWKLPHPMLVHWVVNPGLAFNELFLGQRMPKITLIDKTSDAPLMERQYIPCPHCNTIHNGLLWAKRGAYKNWIGIMCPTCENVIPCLWNLTSLFILAITFPVWGWFRQPLKAKWIRLKKTELQNNPEVELTTAKQTSWFKMGLIFGALMFCFTAVPKFVSGDLTSTEIAAQVGVWLIAGLAFGGVMKFILGRSKVR